jgi:hypothetical protein
LSSNAYEIELPSGVGISPIFNIAYLYSFKWTEDVSTNELVSDGDHTIGWKEQLPRVLQKDIETILHMKVLKKIEEKSIPVLGHTESSTNEGCYLDDERRNFQLWHRP